MNKHKVTQEQLVRELAKLRQRVAELERSETEHEQAEEALLIFRGALDNASLAIGISDPQGHHYYQNKSFTNLFEYTGEELEAAGGGPVTFSSSDIAREVFDSILNGRSWSGETEMISKNGRRFPVLARASAILNDAGRIVGVFGTFTEITERKRAEVLLRESEEKYRALLEHAPDAILIADSKGNFLEVNKRAEELLGYTREELLGMNPWQIHPKEELEKVMHAFRGIAEEEIDSLIDTKVLRKDGETVPVDITGTVVKYGGKQVVQGIFRDVTERKQAEERLVSEHKRLQTLLENAPFGIMLIAENGLITYLNPKFTELFGYTKDNIPDGKAWFVRAYPDPEYRHQVISAWVDDLKAAGVGRPRTRTFTVTCKDGMQKVIYFSSVQIEFGEHLVSLEDRTELHTYQERLAYLSIHDTLTGLLNRRSLEEMLNRAIARAKRGVISSFLYIDLDHFKQVNDTAGHRAGDAVLVTLSGLLREALRTEDILFRVGGDEFGVLLEGINGTEAHAAAERLCSVVAACTFQADKGAFLLSLSIGLIEINGLLTIDELLTKSDTAMYQAKGQGGNSIVVAPNDCA